MNDIFMVAMLVVILLVGTTFFVSFAWIAKKCDLKNKRLAHDVEYKKNGDGVLLNGDLATDGETVHYIIGDLVVDGKIVNGEFIGDITRGGDSGKP